MPTFRSQSQHENRVPSQPKVSRSASTKGVRKSVSLTMPIGAAKTDEQEETGSEDQPPVKEKCTLRDIHLHVCRVLEPKWGSDSDLPTHYTSDMFIQLPATDSSQSIEEIEGFITETKLSTEKADEERLSEYYIHDKEDLPVLASKAAFVKFMRSIRSRVRTAAQAACAGTGTPPDLSYRPTVEFAPSSPDEEDLTGESSTDSGTASSSDAYQPSDDLLDTVSNTIRCSSVRSLCKDGPTQVDVKPAPVATDNTHLSSSTLSVVPSAHGVHALVTERDRAQDTTRTFTTACVGTVSAIEDQTEALQQHYSKILELLQRQAVESGTAPELPAELMPPPLPNLDDPVPGTETLQFAKTCLNELSSALLTGPFRFWPELGESADFLQSALVQLVDTAYALHHELELLSIAHSRHALHLLALRRSLRRHWQQAVDRSKADIKLARQLAVHELGESIESNMKLLEQITYYLERVEKAKGGRGKVLETYEQMLQLSEMKRQEILLLQSTLRRTISDHNQLAEQSRLMQRQLVKMIHSEPFHSLLEEEFLAESEEEFVTLHDRVTQTQKKTEHIKREVKHHLLRMNKSIQLDEQSLMQCREMIVQIKQLKTLTREVAVSTADRFRTLGTLTGHGGRLHEYTQTEGQGLRKVLHTLDEEVMKTIVEESKGARLDMTPIIFELHALQAEAESTEKQAEYQHQYVKEIQKKKRMMQQQHDDFTKELVKTKYLVIHTKRRLETNQREHEAAMAELQRQLLITKSQLEHAQVIKTDMQNQVDALRRDLETLRSACERLCCRLVSRRKETDRTMNQTDQQIMNAKMMLDSMEDSTSEEVDIHVHLMDAARKIQEGGRPDLQRLEESSERLAVRSADLEEYRDQQAAALKRTTDQTLQMEQQTATLKLRASESRVLKRQLQEEIEELKKRRQELLDHQAEYQRHLQLSRAAYGVLCGQLHDERLDHERLVAALEGRCRMVGLCNAAYRIEITRMEKELEKYYKKMDDNMHWKMAADEELIKKANEEFLSLMDAYLQKHKECQDRDWQLQEALLACTEAAKRSAGPITTVMAELNDERSKLTEMVQTAMKMRPFKILKENDRATTDMCPISADDTDYEVH